MHTTKSRCEPMVGLSEWSFQWSLTCEPNLTTPRAGLLWRLLSQICRTAPAGGNNTTWRCVALHAWEWRLSVGRGFTTNKPTNGCSIQSQVNCDIILFEPEPVSACSS